MEPSRISVEEAKRRLEGGERVTFLDSRAEDVWRSAATKIPNAIRVPPDEPAEYLDKIPRDALIVPYCT